MSKDQETGVRSRVFRTLTRPARLRDRAMVIGGALVCAGLIFGLLYDIFDGALRRWADRDLRRRASLISVAVQSHAVEATPGNLQRVLTALAASEDAADLVACTGAGRPIAFTGIGAQVRCGTPLGDAAMRSGGKSVRGMVGNRSVAVTAHVLDRDRTLLVVQDRTFIDSRRERLLWILFIAAEVVLLALLLLAQAGTRIGSRRTRDAVSNVVRQMRSQSGTDTPLAPELRLLVRDVHETVEQLRGIGGAVVRGAERLRAVIGKSIPHGSLVVVANRAPYAHERGSDGTVTIQRPASGLVTGIEPILRACGGTWIAHSSGSADRLHSDRDGRVAVPPGAPEYTLRRLWHSEEEYERYYSGLANEGLWPLCHTAFTQPSFRTEDWQAYQSVNETFARAAVEEVSGDGLLLVQDYHFALVPGMVRERAPHVVTSIFWHIPWPNSEVIGICPWKEALLEGMIGADIAGFHTRQYCLNFLETVQRYLECRVDFDEMSVTHRGHRTLVRPYPISVEWPYPSAARQAGAVLRASLGISRDVHVSIGVDRADYTKGLLERVAAVECLLEENPSLCGRYVLVQLASPTRTKISRYRQLSDDLEAAVQRVNSRFGSVGWKPIVLQMRTFSPEEVRRHYAMADSALVTPLHDGMNLVAKEYVAACDDGDGALVLSVFAGAARELEGALLVNPYDTRQVAQAMLRALRMPAAERRSRMHVMREQIASSSIYDWSEMLLTDMQDIRREGARFFPRRVAVASPRAREVVAG